LVMFKNSEVTSVINQKDHIETCRIDEHLAYKMEKAVLENRRAEEIKPIPAIYDEEATDPSAEPSTSENSWLFILNTYFLNNVRIWTYCINIRKCGLGR
ncbi:hypothetical protein T11_1420, partial [Trichinella zimbabwensis]